MSQTLFITGTETDAGKTVVSVALLQALAAAGVPACGFKPVASGAVLHEGQPASADALALWRASAPGASLPQVNPLLFEPAIAPHLAAARIGRRINAALLTAAHAELSRRFAVVVAEGAGGWLTPLHESLLLGDWVAAQAWPVLLVVRLKLGCLNHALLTAEAIRARGSSLAGWVANDPEGAGREAQGMLDTLSGRLGAPLWTQSGFAAAPGSVLPRLLHR